VEQILHTGTPTRRGGKTDKSDLTCTQWDTMAHERLFITQAERSVVYYQSLLSHLDELENPLSVFQEDER
jgi:hypothetical protein